MLNGVKLGKRLQTKFWILGSSLKK
uniref:Uncharacterized protein n=1 Tax=Rhizophora mucronata TaxID=61149 RepID=A0A2P2NDF0_RHIMU